MWEWLVPPIYGEGDGDGWCIIVLPTLIHLKLKIAKIERAIWG